MKSETDEDAELSSTLAMAIAVTRLTSTLQMFMKQTEKDFSELKDQTEKQFEGLKSERKDTKATIMALFALAISGLTILKDLWPH